MMCMDLIGPISKGTTGHVKHSTPTYIFVITVPFSHMVWLECLSGKSAEELYEKLAVSVGGRVLPIGANRSRKGVRQQDAEGFDGNVEDKDAVFSGISPPIKLHRKS